jgi:hypothetical protein
MHHRYPGRQGPNQGRRIQLQIHSL